MKQIQRQKKKIEVKTQEKLENWGIRTWNFNLTD